MKDINSYIEKFESKVFIEIILVYDNEYKKTNVLSQEEKYNKRDIKFDIQESNTPKFL